MDSYQAVYDAVRSRISNGDVGAVIREVAWQHFDISHVRYILQDAFVNAAAEMQRPCVLFRPRIFMDGNMWCALYGDDLMEGNAGFGDSIESAMTDFDKNWYAKLSDRAHKEPTP